MMQLTLLSGYVLSKFQACSKVLLFHRTYSTIIDTLVMEHLLIHFSCIALAHLIIHTHKHTHIY